MSLSGQNYWKRRRNRDSGVGLDTLFQNTPVMHNVAPDRWWLYLPRKLSYCQECRLSAEKHVRRQTKLLDDYLLEYHPEMLGSGVFRPFPEDVLSPPATSTTNVATEDTVLEIGDSSATTRAGVWIYLAEQCNSAAAASRSNSVVNQHHQSAGDASSPVLPGYGDPIWERANGASERRQSEACIAMGDGAPAAEPETSSIDDAVPVPDNGSVVVSTQTSSSSTSNTTTTGGEQNALLNSAFCASTTCVGISRLSLGLDACLECPRHPPSAGCSCFDEELQRRRRVRFADAMGLELATVRYFIRYGVDQQRYLESIGDNRRRRRTRHRTDSGSSDETTVLVGSGTESPLDAWATTMVNPLTKKRPQVFGAPGRLSHQLLAQFQLPEFFLRYNASRGVVYLDQFVVPSLSATTVYGRIRVQNKCFEKTNHC